MKPRHAAISPRVVAASMILAAAGGAIALAAWAGGIRGPVGNKTVPEPAKPVDLERYLGLWYEMARYENGFERGCEAVTAEYRLRDDGLIQVVNRAHKGAVDGPETVADGRAKRVGPLGSAKLKVSFFGPFYVGDYWVLDHAADYTWSIVGEPSGRFLWLLTRQADPSPAVRKSIRARVKKLGYDTALLRPTLH